MGNIKLLLTLVFSQILVLNVTAQLQPANSLELQFKKYPWNETAEKDFSADAAKMKLCDEDTVAYTYAKATNLRALTLNTNTSAGRAGQWYPAPQPVTIHGFTFYAWQNSGSATPVTLNCRVVLAGSDSLPTGPVVASASISVDSAFGGGQLAVLQKTVTFSPPVTVTFPYVLTVENPSALGVAVVTSDWDSTDGRQEWLSMASIGSIWYHGYGLNIGTLPFDADFMIFPMVTYDIETSFTADTTCVPGGGTVTFTNTSSNPVLESKFYNQFAYNGQQNLSYAWNYNDGSPLDLVFDTSHHFPDGNDYNVTLTTNLSGWTSLCQETFSIMINPAVAAEFSYTRNALNVQFANLSTGAQSWWWDFGDGNTDSSESPLHTYSTEGNYDVTLIAFGECERDTFNLTVSMCQPFTGSFEYNISGNTVDFVVLGLSGSGAFTWTFGDNTGGAGLATAHTYPSAGIYEACLIFTNACRADTLCQQIEIEESTFFSEIKESGFSILVNPVHEYLFLRLHNEKNENSVVRIYDFSGKLIKEQKMYLENTNFVLHLGDLSPGLYFLTLLNDRPSQFARFIKSN